MVETVPIGPKHSNNALAGLAILPTGRKGHLFPARETAF